MSVSEEYIEYVLDQLSHWRNVSARKMFGGVGLFSDGRMFGLIADDVVYLKVDDSNREQFNEAGSSRFKPYPDKPTNMSYFEVPTDILEEPERFEKWSEESLTIQKRKK